ncbi:flavin reductase family protein [Thiomicrorhabdus aquaedulcis]|uniref:flavin reductase family protein n=1 Tax=Thiomicrorhabdus aquaedulcis TaxID=2211106 RepID=UPI000FD7C1C2|nr:flavin reductase family protein [Thiomicrorhabdus aquaedulcis]
MYFNAQELPTQKLYSLLVSGVVPRPIAWVSTLDSDGIANLAPYSFFTVASVQPPILSITHINANDKPIKDTLANLQSTQSCVVNIVSAHLAEKMNATSAQYPLGVSEFEQVGIESIVSQSVDALAVKDAKMQFECRLREVINLSNQPGGGVIILLDVLGINVADEVLNNGAIDAELLDAVGKMSGNDYSHTRQRFSLARPSIDSK